MESQKQRGGKKSRKAGYHGCSLTGPMVSRVAAPSFRRRTFDPLDESGSSVSRKPETKIYALAEGPRDKI